MAVESKSNQNWIIVVTTTWKASLYVLYVTFGYEEFVCFYSFSKVSLSLSKYISQFEGWPVVAFFVNCDDEILCIVRWPVAVLTAAVPKGRRWNVQSLRRCLNWQRYVPCATNPVLTTMRYGTCLSVAAWSMWCIPKKFPFHFLRNSKIS